MDENVKDLLRAWSPPPHSADFDRRAQAAYRREVPWWRRWWSARIEIPLPLVAATGVVLLALGVWLAPEFGSIPSDENQVRWVPVAEPVLKIIPTPGEM
jgi:hypothetical protein